MNLDKLKKIWKKEAQYAFKGWDFSHIEKQWIFYYTIGWWKE